MQVSLVIPAYNASATLNTTLDSVLHQTIPFSEVIVVDQGPASMSEIIAHYKEKFEQRNIRFQQLNTAAQSVGRARNLGAQAAISPQLVFLDADDVLLPHYLEKMLALRQRYPRGILACSHSYRGLSGNRRLGYLEALPNENKVLGSAPLQIFFTGLFVSRELYLSHGQQDETLITGEDLGPIRKMAAAEEVHATAEVLALYTLNPQGLTATHTLRTEIYLDLNQLNAELVQKQLPIIPTAAFAPLYAQIEAYLQSDILLRTQLRRQSRLAMAHYLNGNFLAALATGILVVFKAPIWSFRQWMKKFKPSH